MYVIGLDVGTTGTKALLVDENGSVVARGYQGYGIISGDNGVVEQRAEEWWNAAVFAIKEACRKIDKNKIKGVSLSTQGASSVLVDKNFSTIGNAITWMDKRAQKECNDLLTRADSEFYYRKTGWKLAANLDACKLLWLKRNKPEDLKRAYKFISTLEYMNYCLVGEYVIDPTNGAIRQLMDIYTDEWDTDILNYIEANVSLLSEIRPSGTLLGTLSKKAAKTLELPEGIQVFNGAHDQYCCAIGSGSIKNGDLLLGTGTAWVVMNITKFPLLTESSIAPAKHIIKDLWGALSSIPCGGISLDWWKNKVASVGYDELDIEVDKRLGQNQDLMFFPYFIGAGCPLWNEEARGTFIGLELKHDKMDMALAVMEGVAFHMALLLEDYRANGARIDTLRVMGGSVKSEPWMKIISAVLECKVIKVKQADAAPMGAAIVAAVGAGIKKDYHEAVQDMISFEELPEVSRELKEFYYKKFRAYKNKWTKVAKVYGEENEL